MGIYPSSTEIITETSAHAARVAEALLRAANSFRSSLRPLGGALRRVLGPRRPTTAPLLRFDDGTALEILAVEPWPGFIDCGSAGVRKALRLADLHVRAAKRLDAADYALSVLRQDLAALAPGLIGSLPDRPVHQPSMQARLAPIPPYIPEAAPTRRDLAA